MSDSRSIDLSVEVPGTPEEVWETIATGPGITSWFIPMEIDGRVGGEVTMDFGDFGMEKATVTAWEPPSRVVFESGGERPLAYEWLVEARDGGTCVVRLVNSGFGAGEEWDADFDGMTGGWKIFLESLRLQLTHFRGRRARLVIPTVMLAGPNQVAWSQLCEAVGIGEDLSTGDRLATRGDGVPELAGTVAGTIRNPEGVGLHAPPRRSCTRDRFHRRRGRRRAGLLQRVPLSLRRRGRGRGGHLVAMADRTVRPRRQLVEPRCGCAASGSPLTSATSSTSWARVSSRRWRSPLSLACSVVMPASR